MKLGYQILLISLLFSHYCNSQSIIDTVFADGKIVIVQPYETFIDIAVKQSNNKQYQESAKTLQNGLNLIRKNIDNDDIALNIYIEGILLLIKNYQYLNQIDSIFLYLNEISLYNGVATELLINKDYYYLYKDKRWVIIESKLKNNFAKECKCNNSKLSLELLKMKSDDQYYRKQISILTKQKIIDSLFTLQSQSDSLNQIKLKKIIKENGWPNTSMVGTEAAHSAFLILQHSSYEFIVKIFPLFKTAVLKNEASKADIAYIEDRILFLENKPQKYGTQLIKDLNNQLKLYKTENIDIIDSLRLAVGLDYLDNYLKIFEINPSKTRDNKTIIISGDKSYVINSSFTGFFNEMNDKKIKELDKKLDTLKAIAAFLNKNDSFYLQINIVYNEDFITKNKLWYDTSDYKFRKEFFRNKISVNFQFYIRDSLKAKSYNVKNPIIFQEKGFSSTIPTACQFEFVFRKLPDYNKVRTEKPMLTEIHFWKYNTLLITSNSTEELHLVTYFLKKNINEKLVIKAVANQNKSSEASQKQFLVKESLLKRGINEKRIIIKPVEVMDNNGKTRVFLQSL